MSCGSRPKRYKEQEHSSREDIPNLKIEDENVLKLYKNLCLRDKLCHAELSYLQTYQKSVFMVFIKLVYSHRLCQNYRVTPE